MVYTDACANKIASREPTASRLTTVTPAGDARIHGVARLNAEATVLCIRSIAQRTELQPSVRCMRLNDSPYPPSGVRPPLQLMTARPGRSESAHGGLLNVKYVFLSPIHMMRML